MLMVIIKNNISFAPIVQTSTRPGKALDKPSPALYSHISDSSSCLAPAIFIHFQGYQSGNPLHAVQNSFHITILVLPTPFKLARFLAAFFGKLAGKAF